MLLLLNVLNTGSERTEFTYILRSLFIPSFTFFLLHRNLRRVCDLQTHHGENVLTADCPCNNASKAHLREYMSRRTVQSVIRITA